MPRNGSGNYTPPENTWNPATPDTAILSDDWNVTLDDLALALTQSIASTGETTTTVAIPFAQGLRLSTGTVSAPSLSFISDTDTGFFSPATNELSAVAGGVTAARFTSTGVTFPLGVTFAGDQTITGNLTVNGNTTLGNAIGDTLTVNATATFANPVISATINTLTVATAITVPDASFTNAKLANMATQTIKGRTTAGSGVPEDLTATQATAILNPLVGDSGSGGTKGLAPAPASGDAAAQKYLRADATWAAIFTAQGMWTAATAAAIGTPRGISMVRNGAGDYTFTMSPAQATANYIVNVGYRDATGYTPHVDARTKSTTTFSVTVTGAAYPAEIWITVQP